LAIGGIARATEKFRIGTGVTCPLIRIDVHQIAPDQAGFLEFAKTGLFPRL
jgi:hypothetical protein